MKFLDVFALELKAIFTDVAIVLTIIGGVILYGFLYPQPYAKESVSALSVSMVDLDKSELSREISFNLNATPQVELVRNDMSLKDAQDALVRGEIKAIVMIPAHFSRDVILGVTPTIAVGADSSYFLIYGAVLEGAMKSVLTQSAKIKIASLLKSQTPLSEAKLAYTPYTLESINLFNKDNSYTQYVIPAVFVLILHQTMLIGLGILGGGVNESPKRRQELQNAASYQIIVSRLIIFGSIFFVHMLFYFGFTFETFSITHIGSIYNILSFGVLFIFTTLMFGIFLGTLFSTREIATPVVLFSSMPLIFSIGFIWPLEAIPAFIQELSYLVPVTPAIQGFLRLNQMGASFDTILDSYMLLSIQAAFYTLLAFGGLWFRKAKRRP